MEVALVSPETIRLKGKTAAFVVDPVAGKVKLSGDAVLLLKEHVSSVDVEGSRLTIAGPGEYEISGVKITGVRTGDVTNYFLTLDSITILVGAASSLKGKENLRDVDMVILLADSVVDQSALATIANKVAMFYGPQTQENATALGKTVEPVNKYVVTKDKLPQEMEVVLLQ